MDAKDSSPSRSKPDFLESTLTKRLEIENTLANFRTQLHMITEVEDQTALDDLYARVKQASEGFEAKRVESK